jgi:hypothetical protein
MTIQLELNGVKIKRQIPTIWAEISFKQFLGLEPLGQDYVKVLAFFLEMDEETLRKAKIYGLDGILIALKFLNTKCELTIPIKILSYDLPKDLGLETIGQYADLREDLITTKEFTPQQRLERYTLYCAIYACKPYDWQKAESMRDEFLNAPALEVLAIGHFTLMKLIGLNSDMRPGSQSLRTRTRIRKFRQAFRIWLNGMGIMVRYYIWNAKRAILGKS